MLQLVLPITRIRAGTSAIRTISASRSTAPARPRPNILITTCPPSTNEANTSTMIVAAAVIVRPVACRPRVTASRLSPVRCHSS